MPKNAVALRHVHFEDLGIFEDVLTQAGYEVLYWDVGVHPMHRLEPFEPDLLVVLGGPISVYETAAYPFLAEEIALLRERLEAGRPTFGICLGAQLIAASLGAQVRPTGVKEIGFSPLTLTPTGRASALRHLDGVPVLHWHGDMFAIPENGERLAETAICANQAFALGPHVMGVQFHPEVDVEASLERWLIGHAVELAGAGIDPGTLRRQVALHGTCLRRAGRAMFAAWLEGLPST